jgi:hypothetical protein
MVSFAPETVDALGAAAHPLSAAATATAAQAIGARPRASQ